MLAVIVCIQFATYYLFAKKSIICPIGKHYETYVLFSGNGFEEVIVGANVPLDKDKINYSSPIFEEYRLRLCKGFPEKCLEDPDWSKKGTYHYFIEIKTDGAFAIHTIAEFEHAPEYGARWESLYVWVLFKRVLISKEYKGIS